MGIFDKLSPKKRIVATVDAVVDRLRQKYNLRLHGRLWIDKGEVKFEIDPEVVDRRPKDKINIGT